MTINTIPILESRLDPATWEPIHEAMEPAQSYVRFVSIVIQLCSIVGQFTHMLLKDPASVLGETHVASPGPTTVTIEAWTRQAQASGMGEYQIETLVKMFHYYDRHGFWGNPHTLTSLLGCEPTKFERFIKRTMGQVTNG